MSADMLDDLYIHTCTIVRATVLTIEDPMNPQEDTITGIDFDTPAATTTNVPCRLMSVSSRQQAEQLAANVTVSTHIMQLPHEEAPATLRTPDSVPDPAIIHRVTDVKHRDDGSAVNAGPFDIRYVHDPSGDNTALILLLRRVN